MGRVIRHPNNFFQETCYEVSPNMRYAQFDLPRKVFIGGTGSGKTMAEESICELYYNKGVKIVSITDVKENLENAFCGFKCFDKKTISDLNIYFNKKPKAMKIKLFCPFSKNLKSLKNHPFSIGKKMPPINIFTLPVKELTRENLSVLFNTSKEGVMSTALNILNKLGKEDGLPQFYFNFQKNMRVKKSEDNGYISTLDSDDDVDITKSDIREFKTAIKNLNDYDRFLASEECPSNINMIERLNAKDEVDIYSTFSLNESKSKDLFYDCLLEKIMSALKSGKVKNDVIIRLGEITVLLPNQKTLGKTDQHKTILAKNIGARLMLMRKFGKYGCGFVASGQSLSNISDAFADLGFEVHLGANVPNRDFGSLLKKYGSSHVRSIQKLSTGHWHRIGQTKPISVYIIPPSHAHAIRGHDFFEDYKKIYSENCIYHKDIFNEIMDVMKDEDFRLKESVEDHNRKIKERKQKEKQEKEEAEAQKKKEREPKPKKDDTDTRKLIVNMYKNENLGIDQIAKKLTSMKIKGFSGFKKIKSILIDEGVKLEEKRGRKLIKENRPTPIIEGKDAENFHENINKGEISKEQKELLKESVEIMEETKIADIEITHENNATIEKVVNVEQLDLKLAKGLFNFVKELDAGNGVFKKTITDQFDKCDNEIAYLLSEGEMYEFKHEVYRVLE